MISGGIRYPVASTTALLAAAGIFESQAVDALEKRLISGFVQSAQAGTLEILESADNINFFVTKSISVAAATVVTIDNKVNARYLKFKYTNGATAQTTFNLHVYLGNI